MTRRDEILNRVREVEAKTGVGGHTPARIDISIRAVDSAGTDTGIRSRSLIERVGAGWRTRRFTAAITPAPDAE